MLRSKQVSQHTPRTVIALPNTTAPSTTKPSPPRSLPVLLPSSWPSSSPSSSSSKTNHHPEAIGTTARVSLEADAKASAAVATTTIITDASHIRAGAKSPSPAAARATDEVVITVSRSFNPPASRSPGNKDAIIAALPNAVVGDAQEGGNDDDEVAVLGGRDVAAPPQGGVVSLKGGKSASRMSGPRDGGREKRRRRVVEGEVDERAVRGGEEIGEDGGTRRGEEEGHGMEAEEWQPLAKRKRGGELCFLRIAVAKVAERDAVEGSCGNGVSCRDVQEGGRGGGNRMRWSKDQSGARVSWPGNLVLAGSTFCCRG